MKYNKFIVYLVVMLSISLHAEAQNRDRNNARNGQEVNREELIAKRNTYLVEKMALSAEETAVFIPLENELLRKKLEVSRECHRYERELNNKKEEKTNEEFQKLLRCREEVKDKREKLDKEYLEKFKKVLSAEKILQYQNADKAFFDEFIRNRR